MCARPPGRGPPAGELAAGPASLHGKAALLTPAGCSEGGQAGCQALLPGFQGAERRVSQPTAPEFLQEDRPLSWAGHRGLPQGSLGRKPGQGAQGHSLPTPRQALLAALEPLHTWQADPRSTRGEGVLKGAVRECTCKTPEKPTQGLLPPSPCTPWTCDTGVPRGCVRNRHSGPPDPCRGCRSQRDTPGTLASGAGLSPPAPQGPNSPDSESCPSLTGQPPLSVRGQEPGFGKPFISTAKSALRTAWTGGCPSPS